MDWQRAFNTFAAAIGLIASLIAISQLAIAIIHRRHAIGRWFNIRCASLSQWLQARLDRRLALLVDLLAKDLQDDASRAGALRRLAAEEPKAGGVLHRLLREKLREMMRNLDLPARERIGAAAGLSAIGDPRFNPEAWFLPVEERLGFVFIQEGPFLMGSDPGPGIPEAETPCRAVTLPSYYIARFPVTAAQYRAFLKDTQGSDLTGDAPNTAPVTSVRWDEAARYCRWLTGKLREWKGTPAPLADLLRKQSWEVRLPSEAEWEKAARGEKDARVFPWGLEPDPQRAGCSATGYQAPAPAGCFPNGASPYGVEDLSGNVMEWTRSLWGVRPAHPRFRYPYDPSDGREENSADPQMLRVVRGGSYSHALEDLRCARRGAEQPGLPWGHLGFRVAIVPPRQASLNPNSQER